MSDENQGLDNVDFDNYICPGCKVNGDWEHRCHNSRFGDCDCKDCRVYESFNMMDWEPRECTCKKCAEEKMIQQFQRSFSREEQETIYRFLKLKYKNLPENEEKIVKVEGH